MERLAIGVLGKTFGVRGELRVRSYSGEQEHFSRLTEVTLRREERERTFRISGLRSASPELLISFEGVETPEEAQRLVGWEIVVPREQASPLREGEFYIGDLCQCRMIKEGNVLGVVRAVVEGPASDLLEVVDNEGKTWLVPFMEQYVGEVDTEAKTIELKADWLLS